MWVIATLLASVLIPTPVEQMPGACSHPLDPDT
jgi:hypothetical protein